MSEESFVKDNVIYTDFQTTKNTIWNSWEGWNIHYSNYMMPNNPERLLNQNGMNKYAIKFINNTFPDYKKFSKLNNHDIAFVNELFENKLTQLIFLTREEYNFLNKFFRNYLDVCGITEITNEKEDPGASFESFD